jgi:hypothetical protein
MNVAGAVDGVAVELMSNALWFGLKLLVIFGVRPVD